MATAAATPAIAAHLEMDRQRLMVRADRIMGARLAQTRRLVIAAAVSFKISSSLSRKP
jgi:hypothetical protein